MESVDRAGMSMALYPALRELKASGTVDRLLDNVVSASAEGYSFPTNLDRDQPIGGLAPPSQAELVRQALAENWPADRLQQTLTEQDHRRRTS
ncbi:hypothetical protein [Kribbella deserti]